MIFLPLILIFVGLHKGPEIDVFNPPRLAIIQHFFLYICFSYKFIISLKVGMYNLFFWFHYSAVPGTHMDISVECYWVGQIESIGENGCGWYTKSELRHNIRENYISTSAKGRENPQTPGIKRLEQRKKCKNKYIRIWWSCKVEMTCLSTVLHYFESRKDITFLFLDKIFCSGSCMIPS